MNTSKLIRWLGISLAEAVLLGGVWWGITHQLRAMNQAVNEISDLKDPSPFRVALLGHLGKIHVGIQGYLLSPDPSLQKQITESRDDFEALLPDFQRQNPKLFPPTASDEIRRTFAEYKDAMDQTLQANARRMDERGVLDQNFTRMLSMIDHDIRPLIRKTQLQGEERSEAILKVENQLRTWQQNLALAWAQPSEPARQLTFENDSRGETFLEMYGQLQLLSRESKMLHEIQKLWHTNSDLARQSFALDNVVTQSETFLESQRQQVISVLNRYLPVMPPAELDERKEGYLRTMRLHLAAACGLGLLGIASIMIGAIVLYRWTRSVPPAKATMPISTTSSPKAPKEPTLQMDLKGTIAAWSAAAEVLYGYDAKEMRGQSITKLFESESEIERLYHLLQTAPKTTFDTIHKTKTGRPFPVRIEFLAIDSSGGSPTIGLFCARR